MQPTQPISLLLKRLIQHIKPRRRRQFVMLLALMIIASFAEILSIGAVLPFLAVLTAPNKIFINPVAQPFLQLAGVTSAEQLLMPITVVFGATALLTGLMRMLLLWFSTRLSFATGADISNDIYRRTLYQPYSVHLSRNSSEVVSGISRKAESVIYSVIIPALTLISSCVMLTAILIALFYIDPIIAFSSFGGFGLIYVVVIKLTRKQLLIDSESIAIQSTQVIKSLQEGLGGIRDVLIDGSQGVYCKNYYDADNRLRRAQGNNFFVSQCPRYAMEAFGMLLIAVLAYYLSMQPDGIAKAIPVLGALALGAQRLLPVLQQAYNSWINIGGAQVSLKDTLELLDQPLPDYLNQPEHGVMLFKDTIHINNISFQYNNDVTPVLNKIDFIIEKGSCVGVIGPTGSGKSTLLDILMGLLVPNVGGIEVDGLEIGSENYRSWQAHIAHVPQFIFLADTTVAENIAFGVPLDKIDFDRVKEAARQAQIADVIESLPKQYNTSVGERGVRLSGGQRQRIGIARALYKNADLIILDEATSALDNETEQAVMDAIENLNESLTVIIIAHRLSTLRKCDQILELANGKIKRVGSYKDIVIEDFKEKNIN